MKNWNRLQNAADLGFFYRCEDCACMLHIFSLRAQISQNVKYWYEICDILVPILHSVKFAKCEICGSTKPLTPLDNHVLYTKLEQFTLIYLCSSD